MNGWHVSLLLLMWPAIAVGTSLPSITTPGSGGVTGAVLGLAPGTRAQALGGAFAGLASDSSAVWWNPGGLGQITQFDLEVLGYSIESPNGVGMATVAVPVGPGVAGLGYTFIGLGSYEVRDEEGLKSGVEGLTEMAIFAGWGMKNPGWLPLKGTWGVTVGLGGDAVGQWTPTVGLGEVATLGDTVSAGCVVRNLGVPADGALTPLAVAVGVGWRPRGWVTTSAEIRYGIGDGLFDAGVGAEWNLLRSLSLRAGYKLGPSNGGVKSLSGPTFGFGARAGRIGVNYAYDPIGSLGAMSRLSLTWGAFRR